MPAILFAMILLVCHHSINYQYSIEIINKLNY